MNNVSLTLAFLLSACSRGDAFHIPSPLVAQHSVASLLKAPLTALLNDGSPMLTADGEARWTTVSMNNNNLWIAEGGAFDTVRNIAIGITAVVFLLAGVTFLYASFIIPVAAQELEKECKELDPALWEEYQGKLGEGESMGQRPDLMQELGAKLQPLLEAKIEALGLDGGGGNKVPTALETTMSPIPAKPETEAPPKPTLSSDQWD